ncbi:MAG: PQQ-dependent dehydrogenase, methanol/ethanol family, partial [Candidatus Binatia bacterium]
MTRRFSITVGLVAALMLPALSTANSELMKLMDDPDNWAIWGSDYSGNRYSELDQINAKNVGDLQVAWTFSTGVLRGHEGGPL